MLRFITGKLGRTEKMNTRPENDFSLVFGVLSLACEQKASVSLSVDGARFEYHSMFIDVDRDGLLYIDTIFSRNTKPKRLVPGQSVVKAYFDLNFIRQSFETLFLGMVDYQGYETMKLKMPSNIHVEQRREYFRVEPTMNDPVHMYFEDDISSERGKSKNKSSVLDISAGGASFFTRRSVEAAIVMPISIELPGSEDFIETNYEIIGADELKSRKRFATGETIKYKVRGRFVEISEKYIQMISRYVTKRQREIQKFFK